MSPSFAQTLLLTSRCVEYNLAIEETDNYAHLHRDAQMDYTGSSEHQTLLRTAELHSASAVPGLKFRPRKFQRPLEFLSRFPAVPDEEDAVPKMIPLVAVSWIAGAMSFAETITVRVHNVAGAHAAVIAEGKRGASRTLQQVGIAIEWADCPSADPGWISSQTCQETYEPSRFTVVIDAGFVNAPIEDTALGFALPHLAGRNHAAVVYPRIQQLAAENHDLMDCGTLLSVVLAHEQRRLGARTCAFAVRFHEPRCRHNAGKLGPRGIQEHRTAAFFIHASARRGATGWPAIAVLWEAR